RRAHLVCDFACWDGNSRLIFNNLAPRLQLRQRRCLFSMRAIGIAATFLACAAVMSAAPAQERLRESATVISEVMGTPDKGIPQDLLDKAQCAVVVPNLKKGAFVVGGEYGRGFAICRNQSRSGWGAPA